MSTYRSLICFCCWLTLLGWSSFGLAAPASHPPQISALPSSSPHSQFLTPQQAQMLEQRFGITPEQPQLNQDVNTAPVFGRDYGQLSSPVASPASGSSSDSSDSSNDDSSSFTSLGVDSSNSFGSSQVSGNSSQAPITVRFFFRYDRPSAMAYQVFKLWRLQAPSNVRFIVSIASSGTTFENFGARVYYALVLLKQEVQVRDDLFQALIDKKLDISSPVQLTNWLVNHGVDKDKFIKAINSPEDIALAASAISTTQNYEVTTAPFIVINGKWWVRPSLNMTPVHFIQIADYLVEGLEKNSAPASANSGN